jgi:hypothetical protein
MKMKKDLFTNKKYQKFYIGIILLFVFGCVFKKLNISFSPLVQVDSATGKPVVESNPTAENLITDDQAESLANTLYESMESTGTDESTIESIRVFLVKSPLSLVKVYNKFGLRKYSFFGSPSLLLSGEDKDLKQWLMCELSENKYKAWNELFLKAGI